MLTNDILLSVKEDTFEKWFYKSFNDDCRIPVVHLQDGKNEVYRPKGEGNGKNPGSEASEYWRSLFGLVPYFRLLAHHSIIRAAASTTMDVDRPISGRKSHSHSM